MKNKKLFAILTLVCFMFTLMPVAAFAADTYVEVSKDSTSWDDSVTVDVNATVNVRANNGVTGFFAVDADGELDQITTVNAYFQFDEEGTYKVYAADATKVGQIDSQVITKAAKLELLMELASLVDDYATVKVKASDMNYKIELTTTVGGTASLSGDATNGYTMTIDANEGWTSKGEVTATLYNRANASSSWEVVKGADLTFTTAGYVDVVTEDGTETDRGGDVEFEVIADRAGKSTIYVKYGNEAKTKLTVTAQAEAVADVELVNAPKAPIDVDQNVKNADIEFKFTDASGKAYEVATTSNVVDANVSTSDIRIAVIDKPADSTVDENTFTLVKEVADDRRTAAVEGTDPENDDTGVYTLQGRFDEEGEYTIKVSLKNGNSATVTVDVAEMGDIVGIKFDVYNTPRTVAYNAQTQVNKVLAYDANGVTKALDSMTGEVDLSANGLAIDTFTAVAGAIVTKNNPDYIGSTITVMAVCDGYVATTQLTVVDKAATINYASPVAEVGVNTTLVGTVVDSEGKMSSIAGQATTASALVLSKPSADAIAVADIEVNAKGQILLNFLASEAGEYEVQTTVVYGPSSNFISGIATITVGAGEGTFKDVVVMSIGANNIVVNSDVKAIPAAPMIKDARTFVPFRALAEAFGADVEWVEATQSVVAELNGVKVVMVIGEEAYTVNGVAKTADVAPFINGASTMVPVRFVAEAFGINVTPIAAADGSIADVLFAK